MTIYILTIIFATLFLILCEIKALPKNWYTKIMVIFLLFVFGQRYSAGVDFFGYYSYYFIHFPSEIGYRTIERFFSDNNIYFGNLIFLTYSFTTITSIWFIRKFIKSNYAIYIYILSEFHMFSMSPIRTYLATSFFLIGLYYLYSSKKRLKTFIFIMVATTFHKLTILATPFLLFFKKTKINYRNFILCCLFIIPILPLDLLYIKLASLVPFYSKYANSVYFIKLSIFSLIKYYGVLICYVLFFIKNDNSKVFNFINKGMLTFMFIMALASSAAPLHRIAIFFKIFEILYFSYIFINTKLLYKKLLILSLFLCIYSAITYKDTGTLYLYQLKFLHIDNDISYEQIMEDGDKLGKHIMKKANPDLYKGK